MLNGIDISRYQTGIDLRAVPCDFVIVQHSFGTWTSPVFSQQAQGAIAAGKLLGIYHYVTGSPGEGEYFVNGIRKYAGQAVIALDFESGDNQKWGDWDYLRSLIRTIQNELHVNPLLYGPASAYPEFHAIGGETNCGLWVAQYASMEATGYQKAPWNEQAYDMAIFQYSSTGALFGYAGALDLDLFYGDREAWAAYARQTTKPAPKPEMVESAEASKEFIEENKGTLPAGKKITIGHAGGRFLISHNGQLVLSDESQPFFVQRNGDDTISLADQWGNWFTYDENAGNGSHPYISRGNGQITQKWVAYPFEGGFALCPVNDVTLRLDLPNDDMALGTQVQLWAAWKAGLKDPNQVWTWQEWFEPAPVKPAPKEEVKPEPKPEPKPMPKTVEKSPVEPIKKEEDKTMPIKPEENVESRAIADLKDLSDISKTAEEGVGDDLAGVVEAMFGTKKASKKMSRAVFIGGAIITLAVAVIVILSSCGIMPKAGMTIASIVEVVYTAFAHALGISLTSEK